MARRANLDAEIEAELERWSARGLRRELALADRGLVDFTSNDYLGLARSPQVVEAAREALRQYGAGGRASRLLGGGSPFDERAEAAAARFLGAESSLFFQSGYHANLGLLTSLVGPGDAILSDELNHASLIDAARASRARIAVYRHADVEHARSTLLRLGAARRVVIATESVFSMDGDLAPLAELAALARERGAWIVVDEAHAVGLTGPEGAGAWAELGPDRARDEVLAARMFTGGKALGVGGAFVACSRALRELMIHRARSFVFTTAPSPAMTGALCAAIELARHDGVARAKARELARRLALACDKREPAAAIVPLVFGDSERALQAAAELRAAGLDVRAVRPPTVAEGSARLRVVCHSFNSEAQVERLIECARPLLAARPRQSVSPHSAAELLVVAGTDTGIGKTVVSALLVRDAARHGAVAYWKPVQTGDESDTRTVAELAAIDDARRFEPRYAFALAASPHTAAAAEHSSIDVDELERAYAAHRAELGSGRLVAELAGGLLVPLDDRTTQLDLLARLRAPLVLVARSGLGTLNHTLLSLEALRARSLEPRALFLVGEPHASNRATLERFGGVARIFEVERFEPLETRALDAWLESNDLAGIWNP